MCVRRCLSRAKHNRRSQKDDAHGDSTEQVTGCALAGRLWSTGGLSVFPALSQLSLVPVEGWKGQCTCWSWGLSYRMEPSQVRGSELTLEGCNYRRNWRVLAWFLCSIPCPRKDEKTSVLGVQKSSNPFKDNFIHSVKHTKKNKNVTNNSHVRLKANNSDH